MSKAQIVRKSFNGGEIAPELHYRSDLETYHNACKSLKNMTVTPWGAATRRPPTELLAKIDTATYGVPVKYLPFRFSLTETFHIIFTDGSGSASTDATTADFIVFDADGVLQTLDGASTKILTTVYDPADLGALHHIQINDFIYMTCGGDYPVQALSRFFDKGESENRWKVRNFDLAPMPLSDQNADESDLLSVGLESWDSSATYEKDDMVGPAFGSIGIVDYELAYRGSYIGYGNDFHNYRPRITLDHDHTFQPGDIVSVRGLVITSQPGDRWVYLGVRRPVNIDGDLTVAKVESNRIITLDAYWTWYENEGPEPDKPVVDTASATASSNKTSLNSFYRSLQDSNIDHALTDTAWWKPISLYQGAVKVRANSDLFSTGDVGRNIAVTIDDSPKMKGEWALGSDLTSDSINAQGTVTLTTEGGAWSGLLELQESKNDGGTWKTIGFIRSQNGSTNSSIERNISGVSSIIRVRLTESSNPTINVEPKKLIWNLRFSGRVKHFSRIIEYVDSRNVKAQTLSPMFSAIVDHRWQLGEFSETTGYPNTLTIHDERMVFGGTKRKPNTVWASRVNDWTNFLEGDTEVSPYTFTIKSDSFDTIRWMRSTRNLMIGTENSESTMGTLDDNSVISPTNIDVRTQTYFGSANIQAVVTADLVFFVQGQKRRVRSTQYDFGTDQYLSSEMSILAHHITKPGIKEMSFRRHPYSSIFFVLEDGRAVSFTYERDNQVKGWARMEFGGEGFIVSAASNYSEQGDIIAGIMRRNNDYFLETFGSLDSNTMYLDGQVSYERDDFFQFGSGHYGLALPFSTVDESTIVVLKNGEFEPLGGSENVNIYFDDETFTPGQWVVFVKQAHFAADDVITVGFKYDFEIEPTDIIELGDFGAKKRISKLGLYLLDSGGCDISVNGEDCPFQEGDGLEPGGRLNGEYQVSVGGGTEWAIRVKLSGDHHKPFNISAFGVFGQPSR